MQSDSLDKKIKEAADHHHPAYDENAWNKMEKLLDTHLPQKKDDRRRIIFFLFLFLLLGGSTWLLVSKPWSSSKQTAQFEQPKTAGENISSKSNTPNNTTDTKPINQNDNNTDKTKKVDAANKNNSGVTLPDVKTNTLAINNTSTKHISKPVDKENQKKVSEKFVPGNKQVNPDENTKTQNLNSSSTVSATTPNNVDNANNKTPNEVVDATTKENTKKTDPVNNIIDPKSNVKTDTKTSVVSNPESKKEDKPTSVNSLSKNSDKKKKNFFSFSLSAGPDISKVGGSSTGRTTLSYGAGINYTMNRFTLHSGFYVAKKIYDANGSDYKLPYTLPSNIKLTNVAANCNVFEIPLDLTYNFAENKKGNFYAGGGLSSYLMKKEKYTYLYTYSSGQTYLRNDGVSNKNKHYFSIANILVGYTRKISKTVSISAEPYIKIPLTGIGMGKVRLNSGGILLTVGVSPFQKKK